MPRQGELTYFENVGEADAVAKRSLGRALNRRAVGDRIAEGHAQLDDGRARAREFDEERAGRLDVGVARRDERDEAATPLGSQALESFRDAAQLVSLLLINPREDLWFSRRIVLLRRFIIWVKVTIRSLDKKVLSSGGCVNIRISTDNG